MPQRLTVAGEAYCKLSHSKMKLTLFANWMRSPLGMVSSLHSRCAPSASAEAQEWQNSDYKQESPEYIICPSAMKAFV